MTPGILTKNTFLALLLAFAAATMLPACSSSDESSNGGNGGNGDPGCDPGDSKEECADAML
jgi:hypothetical protein